MDISDQLDEALQSFWSGDSSAMNLLVEAQGTSPARLDSFFGAFSSTPLRPLARLEIGEDFGGFRLLRELGRGGMGVVYAAEQMHPRRTVALKVISPGFVSPATLERFEREIQLLARLQHPGIAQLFEAGTADTVVGSQPYYAMEWVQGRPLTDYLAHHSHSIRERLHLFAKICDAVQHAHQNGVIHRDLKPGNVLVQEGSGFRVSATQDTQGSESTNATERDSAIRNPLSAIPKILDFGVARVTESDRQNSTATELGQMVGTLAYMSPEQVRGDARQIDTRTDIYALGVILYEILADRPPLNLAKLPLPEAARQIAEVEPPGLGTVRRELRGDLETIVAKAMAKQSQRRYQSAGELARDVRHYLAGEPIDARRDSTWYVLRTTLRRHRLAVAASAAFVLLVAGSSVVLSLLVQRQSQLIVEVNREKERAVAAEAQAIRRFEEVRSLAHAFMYDFHDQIANLAGATSAREFLVSTALDYLNGLAAEAGDDRAVLRELAEAYAKIGSVQGNPNNSNLGNTQGAFQSYQRSLEMYDRLIAAAPEAVDIRLEAARTRLAVGDMLQQLGQSDEALNSYTDSLADLKELSGLHPDNLDIQRDLSLAHLKVGYTLASLGKVEEGLSEQLTSLEMRRRFAADPGGAAQDRRELCQALIHVGDRMTDLNNPLAALKNYQESLVLRQFLLDEDPENATDRRSLAVAWTRIGNVQGNPLQRRPNLGDVDAAAASYAKAMEVFFQLCELDPENMRAKRDLSVAYEKLGDIESVRSRPEPALAYYRKALNLNLECLELDPGSVMAKQDVVTSQVRVAKSCAAVNERDVGMQSLEHAEKLAGELHEAEPRVVEHEYGLAWVCAGFGDFYETFAERKEVDPLQALADWEDALSWHQRSLDRLISMRERGILPLSNNQAVDSRTEDIEKCKAAIQQLLNTETQSPIPSEG